MVARVKGRVVDLSMHKFSSNLIEKCLLYGADAQRDAIVAEMLLPRGGPNPYPGAPGEDNIALNDMVRDQYANFVVGRALEVCTLNPSPIRAATARRRRRAVYCVHAVCS